MELAGFTFVLVVMLGVAAVTVTAFAAVPPLGALRRGLALVVALAVAGRALLLVELVRTPAFGLLLEGGASVPVPIPATAGRCSAMPEWEGGC